MTRRRARTSWLRRAAGLPCDLPLKPLDDAGSALLVAAAEAFLAVGGAVTVGDWLALEAEDRAALMVAAERLAAVRAAQLGLAAQDPAAVLAPVDGGAARRRAIVERAAAKAAHK